MTLFSYGFQHEQQTTGRQNKSETGRGDVKTVRFKRSFTLLDTKKEERKKPASPRVCQAAAAVATVRHHMRRAALGYAAAAA
jgi:hypothetical protein